MDNKVFIQIAGIRLALFGTDPGMKLQSRGALRRFEVHPSNPDIEVSVKWEDLSENRVKGKKIFESGSLWQLYSENGHFHFLLTSPMYGATPYKIGRVQKDFKKAEVSLHLPYFDPDQPIDSLEYPLDELILTNFLALGRGAEIHACGVADSQGNGQLFVGQSGAGKTTMARLWDMEPRTVVLNDDRIILRKINGHFWMYGTPWHGDAQMAFPDRAPIFRVYFLARGVQNEIIPLKKSEAAGRLFTCSFPPFYSKPGINFTLGFLSEVAKKVPCYELRFLPNQSVLEYIQKKSA